MTIGTAARLRILELCKERRITVEDFFCSELFRDLEQEINHNYRPDRWFSFYK